jgi:anti-sigma regulatory factor (Ser/Thr protein kinase)
MKDPSVGQSIACRPGWEGAEMTPTHWRLRSVAASPAEARAAARGFLARLTGSFPDEDAAVLVVSELVTNAVEHSGSGPLGIDLSMELLDDRLRIVVDDHDPHPPVMGAADPDGERGRGLLIVDRLAEQWGWEPVAEDGKRVWCELAR